MEEGTREKRELERRNGMEAFKVGDRARYKVKQEWRRWTGGRKRERLQKIYPREERMCWKK